MIWLGLALALIAVALAGILWVRRRGARAVHVVVSPELAPRLDAAIAAFATAPPWEPAAQPGAPAAAAAIEAALIERAPARALEAAEAALAAAPEAAAARVWLAWALCANAQPAAALDQLAGADAPLARYVRARATHLRFEHAAGATGAVPALVTTADLAVVTLASGRGAATWLQGKTEVQLSAAQARAAIAEHREVTARCLAEALAALEAAPGFVDAAYLCARLAVKLGMLAPARALFAAVAPRITGRPDADSFARDRRDLDDPEGAVAAAKLPPAPGTAKRSRSLKVLS